MEQNPSHVLHATPENVLFSDCLRKTKTLNGASVTIVEDGVFITDGNKFSVQIRASLDETQQPTTTKLLDKVEYSMRNPVAKWVQRASEMFAERLQEERLANRKPLNE